MELVGLSVGENDRRILALPSHDVNLNRLAVLALKYLQLYIAKDLTFSPPLEIEEYRYEYLGHIKMIEENEGEQNFTLSLSGKGISLLKLANPFVRQAYTEVNKEAKSAVCELLNCIAGLFVSELSDKGIEFDVTVPSFFGEENVKSEFKSNGAIYCVPILIDEQRIDLLVTQNANNEIGG